MSSNKLKKTLHSKSNDEATIRNLYQRTIDGWNKGSGDAFAAPYSEAILLVLMARILKDIDK